MGFSNWRSLRSDGTIADTPGAGFQYKYSIDELIDPSNLQLINPGKFRVQITSPDNTVLFDSTVELKYYFVWLGGSSLLMFTWWVDLQNQRITTTVPEDVQTLGTEQGYAIPAGGGDIIAGQAHLMFDWYSGVYQVPIPAGSKFTVKFHNIGLTALIFSRAAIQTRVIRGGELTGARLEQDGMIRLVQPRQGGGLEFLGGCDVRAMGARQDSPSAWPYSGSEAPTRAQIESIVTTASGATTGKLFYLHEVTPVVIYQEGNRLRAVRSVDDGVTWGEPMEIASGVTMVAADVGLDGGTIYIVGMRGQSPVGLICSFERDAAGQTILRATDEFPALGLPNLPASLQVLKIQNGVFHLVVSQGGGIKYWQSSDGMRSWE